MNLKTGNNKCTTILLIRSPDNYRGKSPDQLLGNKTADPNGPAVLALLLSIFYYHPLPGASGILEAAALSLVDKNSIEAAVNAVIPVFLIASLRVIFLSASC